MTNRFITFSFNIVMVNMTTRKTNQLYTCTYTVQSKYKNNKGIRAKLDNIILGQDGVCVLMFLDSIN